jgi:hypothetical protein
MGATPSPYNAFSCFAWVEESIQGKLADAVMPFCWHAIELKLPGSKLYDPTRPWVSKRRKDGKIANDLVSFMDDLRMLGSSEKECQMAGYRTSSIMNWYVVQDASRKSRPPSQNLGAWSGGFVRAGPTGVHQSTSQQKWDKYKAQVKLVDKLYTRIKVKLVTTSDVRQFQDQPLVSRS